MDSYGYGLGMHVKDGDSLVEKKSVMLDAP
jgi:hypothetical protein